MSIEIKPYSSQKPSTSCQHQASSIEHRVSSIEDPVSGFTLLEVMIAMAIMAIVLVSVYRLHSQTLTMATANRFYTQAPLLAQSKMAQLEAISSGVVSGDSGDFGDKFPGYGWSVSTEEVSSEVLGEAAEELKRIDVTVTLNGNEYEHTIRLYRMMSE
jgi:general secretion pathway protein I